MKRLQGRLIWAFVGVILLTVCSIGVAMLFILRQNPLEDRLAFMELDSQVGFLINSNLRRLPDWERVRRDSFVQLEQFATRRGLRLALTTPQKVLRFDSAHIWDNSPPVDVFANLRSVASDRWHGELYEDGERWLLVAHPLPSPEGIKGYVIVARTVPTFTFFRRFMATIAVPLLQASVVVLMVSVILAALISYSIARPLQKVAEAARALAVGNLDARAPVAGPEEVRDVAQTFNEMAQQVQASQQAQRDLVANVAHDLRTPLTAIQGFAQALVDGTAATPERQMHAATVIYEEAQRMHRMTNSLLDLARFEAGEIRLRRASVDMITLARKRVAHFAPQAQHVGVQLTFNGGAEPLIVAGDSARLEQMLDNLLNNALAHTPRKGHVNVIARAVPSWCELVVVDTGAGIPAMDLPRIFERFYRGDKARRGAGTGLGLAIVREITRAHQGTIVVESTVEVGSKFTVRLPLTGSLDKKIIGKRLFGNSL